jgi:hypothetical protein
MNNEIPNNLRPFFPYLAEVDLPNQIVLRNKETGYHKYFFLVFILILILSITGFADLITVLTSALGFLSSLFLGSVPDKINVSPSGITLTYNPVFIPIDRFLGKEDIRSIKYSIISESADMSSGCILVNRSGDRVSKILPLIRVKRDLLREDLNTITGRLTYILALPTNVKFQEELLHPKPKYFGINKQNIAVGRDLLFIPVKRTRWFLKLILITLSAVMLLTQISLFAKYLDVNSKIFNQSEKELSILKTDNNIAPDQKQKKIEAIEETKRAYIYAIIIYLATMLIPLSIIFYVLKGEYFNPHTDQ